MPIRDTKNPWGSTGPGTVAKSQNRHRGGAAGSSSRTASTANNPDKKFLDIRTKHLESARKYAVDCDSSSDEESDSSKTLLDSVFQSYSGDVAELKKTQQFLENVFQSGAATCLICISSIKRTEAIWSCVHCYSFFHLPCIQRWANDSTSIKRRNQELEVGYYNNQGEYIAKEKKPIRWDCPNCRHDYRIEEIPRRYACFCQKEIDPPNQPWLVPHSCGEKCQKYLEPNCGHRCLLLCHPGPCPSCPQMVTTSCCCGQSQPKTVRCSQKIWRCLQKCKLKLECGIHMCGQPCHAIGDCPSCTKQSQQACLCGAQTQQRNCKELIWQCTKTCNKVLSCGLHKCQIKCHGNGCGECPLGLPRACPCGKKKTQAPCSEEIGPCGDTCQKVLPCGLHICMERCHKGECSQCLEIVRKQCRCGNFTKELPCNKTFSCETKCKQMRDCNKHPCNRKCCDNQCPPCDKICGKTLSCGKHKCTSLCHHGLCYPCTEKTAVKCRCGYTVIYVPCGREKKTRPPKCFQQCKIPSKCHHTNPHRCHQNDCPPCVQRCLLPNSTTRCAHPCEAQCHDAVAVSIKDKNFKPVGPWDVQVERIEIQKLPHPKCEILVPVTCIGGHETCDWPCYNSKPQSCGRQCDRKLKCGNHVCELNCHTVSDVHSKNEQETCSSCTRDCIFPRPQGCYHKCDRQCHLGRCNECAQQIKMPCHCGLSQVHFKCGDYFTDSDTKLEKLDSNRESMKSCGNQCIKNYSCGHRCTSVCHSGVCPFSDLCKKKIKAYCECKLRKITITCDRARAGFVLACDEICAQKKDKERMEAEEEAVRQRLLEEEKNRQEVVDFEKKFGKKRYRERKRNVVEDEESNLVKILMGIGVVTVCVSIAVYFVYFH